MVSLSSTSILYLQDFFDIFPHFSGSNYNMGGLPGELSEELVT